MLTVAEALVARLRAQATFVPDSRPGDVILEAADAIEAADAYLDECVAELQNVDIARMRLLLGTLRRTPLRMDVPRSE